MPKNTPESEQLLLGRVARSFAGIASTRSPKGGLAILRAAALPLEALQRGSDSPALPLPSFLRSQILTLEMDKNFLPANRGHAGCDIRPISECVLLPMRNRNMSRSTHCAWAAAAHTGLHEAASACLARREFSTRPPLARLIASLLLRRQPMCYPSRPTGVRHGEPVNNRSRAVPRQKLLLINLMAPINPTPQTIC